MKIDIVVPVWNRKKITELALHSLNKYKDNNRLFIYNDHSTEYDDNFLSQYCDQVITMPNKMGVQHLRWYQLREFLKSDSEFLYLTDNDTIHDPEYINTLISMYNKYMLPNGQKLPICLYNTIYHSQPQNRLVEKNDIIIRKTAPGVSMFFDKKMVTKIVDVLNKQHNDPDYAWDYRALEYLALPWITTKTSYVEHFGESGLHSPKGIDGMNRDRAINPTQYLQDIRNKVIDYVLLDGESPISLL